MAAAGSAFGQPFVVENRSGAGGNIGAEAVAKAGDPHALLIGGNGPVINKHRGLNFPEAIQSYRAASGSSS